MVVAKSMPPYPFPQYRMEILYYVEDGRFGFTKGSLRFPNVIFGTCLIEVGQDRAVHGGR